MNEFDIIEALLRSIRELLYYNIIIDYIVYHHSGINKSWFLLIFFSFSFFFMINTIINYKNIIII